MSAFETVSMTNGVGINISPLRILLKILRYKIGANLFEPETKMIGEYNYIHEFDSKPELILYWVRDFSAALKKGITLFIYSKQLRVNEISRIDVIVGGNHGKVLSDLQ